MENISSAAAKNIQATLEFDTEDSPFEIEKLNLTYFIDRINGKKIDDAIFEVNVSESASEKIYPLKLKLIYYPLSGRDPETDEYTINVRVKLQEPPAHSIIVVMEASLIAGEQRKVSVVLRNNGAWMPKI